MRLSRPARGALRLALLAPLRHRPFQLLYAGQVVSNLGDWLDLLALLALIVYQWRLGAAALAALTLVHFVPQALLAPALGGLADRCPRRRVMIACDLGRAAVVLALVWAPNLPSVLALVSGASVLSTLFGPARQAAVRLTVPADDLLAANSLSRLSTNVTKVLGPALGGVLVALVGPRAAFVADSLSFLVSAAILARLPALDGATGQGATSEPGAAPGAARRFWAELRAGLAHIAAHRLLLVAVAAAVAEMFLVETNDSLSVLAFKNLGITEAVVGLALAASGLGNVAGALAIGSHSAV